MTDIYLVRGGFDANGLPVAVGPTAEAVEVPFDLFTPAEDDGLDADRPAAYDAITRPSHYNSDRWPCECKDFTRYMSFPVGNAFKYVWRHADKGASNVDLGKAVEYLTWAAEDNAPVFARNGAAGAHYRNKAMVAEVDDAVAYALERSRDVPTLATYTALSLIVRAEYALAAQFIRNVV